MSQPGLATAGSGNPSKIVAGKASIPLGPNLANLTWRLEQLTVSVGSATDPPTSFTVYLAKNTIPITSRTTGQTPLSASGDPPMDIGSHETLTVEVSGISSAISQVVEVAYQYDELSGY